MKLRRSLVISLTGDGWAVFAAPVNLPAEGRPSVATASSVRDLQSPGEMPMRRPCCFCLEAGAVCFGSLTAPSGSIPGGEEVNPEQKKIGPDCVSVSLFEVLSVIV